MDLSDTNVLDVFFDVQSDLPRQGPGDDASTRRALTSCTALAAAPRVLDVGCGPGAQTLALAALLPAARITAIDPKTRKIALSIKQREIAEEKEAVAEYGSTESGASLGDILGAAMAKAKAESGDDEKES